jgi:hypothetical protein
MATFLISFIPDDSNRDTGGQSDGDSSADIVHCRSEGDPDGQTRPDAQTYFFLRFGIPPLSFRFIFH